MRLFTKPVSGSELQTAELVYQRVSDGAKVTVYGAVHVGDGDYYQGLAKAFQAHQVLLYELVADETTTEAAKAGARLGGKGGLGGAYKWLSQNLKLHDQVSEIDYSAPNFLHADLSPEGLRRAMEERGESVMSYAVKAMQGGMKGEKAGKGMNEAEQILLLMGMMSGKPDSERMKYSFARQLSNADETLAAIEGEKGSALIAARNEAALKVLDNQVAEGKRDLAIFYGAGHLPDFDRRLIKNGFTLTETKWRAAWVMTHPKPRARPEGETPVPAPETKAP